MYKISPFFLMAKTIIHISDLHFGTENLTFVQTLLKEINQYKPDLVIVSGDFTQRARKKQFKAASEFLNKIPYAKIVIPGNHDVAFFNLFYRIFNPLRRFKKHIHPDLYPCFKNSEIAVLGVDSTASHKWKSGHLSKTQIEIIKNKLSSIDNKLFKILAMHHNILPSPGSKIKKSIENYSHFIRAVDQCGLDLILSGHLHKSYCGNTQEHYQTHDAILVIQAGTAVSRRRRGEANSYNLITINGNKIGIQVRGIEKNRFLLLNDYSFQKTNSRRVLNSDF